MSEGGATTGPDPAASARAIYAAYLAMQALGGVVLWVLIDNTAFVRSGFELLSGRHAVTDAFFPADLVVIVASAVSSYAVREAKDWALPVLAFTAGGVVYPTVYLLAWVAFTDGPARPALGVMLVVSMLTGWALFGVWRLDRLATPPKPDPAAKVWDPPPAVPEWDDP